MELSQAPEPEYREPLETELEYVRLMEKIALIVENLPECRREIFRMYYYSRMNTRSIAHQLNIREQTVRNQLSRAIIHLRQALQ